MRNTKYLELSPEEALTMCGESEGLENVSLHWEESGAAMPDDVPSFLQESEWRESREWGGLADEDDDIIRHVTEKIVQSPALLRLAWHCYWRLYLVPEPCPPSGWPEFRSILGDDCGVFRLLMALGAIPLMRRWHRTLGIPEGISRNTALQIRSYCDCTYRPAHNGHPGVFPGPMGWMRHYSRERYFRIGRLEFWLAPYKWSEQVFRNRRTGQVAAFAAEGMRFNSDGRVFAKADHYVDGEGWTASFCRTDTHVTGYLLDPNGYGSPRQVTLPFDQWDCRLEKGVMTLQMHIPAGGAMTPEACRDSFVQARAFFAEYFPNEPAVAITCGSWIFSPLLQKCLPDDTNLVRFQHELFLVPSPANGSDGLWFVFLEHGQPDFNTWPRQTRVQRAILEYLEQGHIWGAGRMFFLLEDTARFGQEIYRKAGLPSAE